MVVLSALVEGAAEHGLWASPLAVCGHSIAFTQGSRWLALQAAIYAASPLLLLHINALKFLSVIYLSPCGVGSGFVVS